MYAALIITNVVFGAMVFLAWWKPNVARNLFALVFMGAALFNAANSIFHPESYWSFGELAIFKFYRDFIGGAFHDYTRVIILLIAMGQAIVSLALIRGGNWARVACWGGIMFGIGIAPLGIGSGFPASLLMAVAFWILSTRILNPVETVISKVSHP